MTLRTFTLAASNAAGSAQASASVTVADAPPTPGAFPQPTIYPIANRARQLMLDDQQLLGRYERAVRQKTIGAGAVLLRFHCQDDGGTAFTFASPLYKLLCDGVECARYSRIGAEKFGTFSVTLTTQPDADAEYTVRGCNLDGTPDLLSPECNVPHVMTNNRNGTAQSRALISIQRGTFDWERMPAHATVKVPRAWFTPKAEPLPPWTQPQVFTTRIPGSEIVRVLLGPSTDVNCVQPHHLCKSLDGVEHTNCMQGYFERGMFMDHTENPNLDGERNIATHYFNLFTLPGRVGKWYSHSPVSWTITTGTGRKITRFGKRHRYAPDWQQVRHGGPEEQLVGRCTDPRVPLGEAYLRNSWGGDWDYDTLGLDPTAPPIGTDQPHLLDPVWWATDDRGWLWKLTSDGNDPNRFNDPSLWAEVLGQLWITGLNLPRAVRHRKGTRELVINEAGAHRIGRWSADTPQTYIGPVLENLNGNAFGSYPTMASGNPRRWRGPDARSAAVQAEAIIAPEGGDYYRDADGEWWAWGSPATMDIRRINLGTGVRQKVGDLSYAPQAAPGNQVVQICVNDNTINAAGDMPRGGFGPHGSLFGMTFYNKEFGRPQIFTPNGDGVTFSEWGNWHAYDYDTIAGRGPKWSNSEYPTAPGVGYGQLAECTSLDGFAVYRKANANDPPALASGVATRGHNYYKSKGYDLLGLYGYTPNGQRPWGEDVDMDKWLVQHGHAKP